MAGPSNTYQSSLQDTFDNLVSVVEKLFYLRRAQTTLNRDAAMKDIEVLLPGKVLPVRLGRAELANEIPTTEVMVGILKGLLQGCKDLLLVRNRAGLDVMEELVKENIYLAPHVCCLSFLGNDVKMGELLSLYNFNTQIVTLEAFGRTCDTPSFTGRK